MANLLLNSLLFFVGLLNGLIKVTETYEMNEKQLNDIYYQIAAGASVRSMQSV